MANKSRKRIMHELRVRNAEMERELKALREKQLAYQTLKRQILEIHSVAQVRRTNDPGRDGAVLGMETERAVRHMVEQIVRHGAVEVSKEHIFNPTWADVEAYKFTLRVLKRT